MFWTRNKKNNIWRSDHAVWTTKLALTDFEKSVVLLGTVYFMEWSLGAE